MKNETAKKILHGICGVIFGFFAVLLLWNRFFRVGNSLIPALCGAIIMGILAFLYTDSFWENLSNQD